MPSRSPAQKPFLTDRMRKQRLNFAKQFIEWTPEMWENVVWSDESTFRCISERQGRVRRPVGSDRYDPRYTSQTVEHSDYVMIWGCFSGKVGRGGLYFLTKNQTMNGDRYLQVLEDHLLSFIEIHDCNFLCKIRLLVTDQ